ncbi:hypothetical protein VZT92_017151 [Zoarces viviparus]|uniref:Uncharacterized protein n=1 Tax=Zoarces viviparus TaxID=48416 RepID=A0AAW1ERF4_ZOAVI
MELAYKRHKFNICSNTPSEQAGKEVVPTASEKKKLVCIGAELGCEFAMQSAVSGLPERRGRVTVVKQLAATQRRTWSRGAAVTRGAVSARRPPSNERP